MKIELGCGACPTEGYTHCDKYRHSPHVEMVFDLENIPWPFCEEMVEEILATDVFEHLDMHVQRWLDECWRVLKPFGLLNMRLPSWNHPQGYGFRDPTHYRLFTEESFHYWCPKAPGTLWENFGRYYFGEGYFRWWELVSVEREQHDIRFKMRKIG